MAWERNDGSRVVVVMTPNEARKLEQRIREVIAEAETKGSP
jgi:hypothetical protein